MPVESLGNSFNSMPLIQAGEVNAPAIGMRARLVKAFDPANPAEQVFGSASAKAIGVQIILSLQQFELCVRDIEMQIAGARAYGTIAVEQFNTGRHLDSEADGAAVTAALCDHSTVTDFARLRG